VSKEVFNVKTPSEDLAKKKNLGATLGLIRDVINSNIDDHTHFRIIIEAIDEDDG